jgi:hypothetical protein
MGDGGWGGKMGSYGGMYDRGRDMGVGGWGR